MKLIERFKINSDHSIEILIHHFEDKVNYYAKPSKELHQFDEVTIVYKTKEKEVVLFKDILNEAIISLKNTLIEAFEGKRLLSNSVDIGKLGYHYNLDAKNDDFETVDYSLFWLWSTQEVQTWLYNKNSKMYLEISPSYPWFFGKSEKEDKHLSFDQFMKTYNPLVIEKISKDVAQKWLDQCNNVLTRVITF